MIGFGTQNNIFNDSVEKRKRKGTLQRAKEKRRKSQENFDKAVSKILL